MKGVHDCAEMECAGKHRKKFTTDAGQCGSMDVRMAFKLGWIDFLVR